MSFAWREINAALSAPNATLAGRNDGAAESAGDAAGALVQRGAQAFNDASVEHAFRAAQAQTNRNLATLFEGHATGGMLAVVTIETFFTGEISTRRFRGLEIVPGIYAQPQHAMYQWRHMPRIVASTGGGGEMSYQFYWITRAGG